MANQDFGLYLNDLLIRDGDFVIGVGDTQHITDTLNAFPGWWKQYPPDGVGVFQYLNSAGQEQTIERSIILQLTSDGYVVKNPSVDINAAGQLTIYPNAEP